MWFCNLVYLHSLKEAECSFVISDVCRGERRLWNFWPGSGRRSMATGWRSTSGVSMKIELLSDSNMSGTMTRVNGTGLRVTRFVILLKRIQAMAVHFSSQAHEGYILTCWHLNVRRQSLTQKPLTMTSLQMWQFDDRGYMQERYISSVLAFLTGIDF